jgi:pyrroline-5-carboxylate reductase
MDLSSAKIGFIGAGNMAQAIGKGIISSGKYLSWCRSNHLL